jgi:hypothetical protein
MSIGNDLQEMEVSTKKSVTAVNRGAKPSEAMPKLSTGIVDGQSGNWEDLGGPTPFNSRSTDDSNKLSTPGKTLKQVSNVVNKGAKAADAMQKLNASKVSYEDVEYDEEEYDEEEYDEEDEILESSEKETEGSKKDKKEDKKEYGKKNPSKSEEDDEEEDDEKEYKEDYDFDFSEDVNALIGGEGLSEEFKNKATVIFEAAVKTKISEIRENLQIKFDNALIEEVNTIKEELTERVDSYLEYVSSEWIEENALQVETGLKSQFSESFMTGLKELFEEHYVEIPEDKYNVLEGMVERLDEMEYKLNEQIERNVQLNQRLSEAVSDTIFNDVTEGLALTQKEKLASLVESVEFEGEEDYREKLETLKESYFTRNTQVSSREEVLLEGVEDDYGPQMNSYLRALGKFSK